ncbi:MAG: DEAD/DEAH box helicase [Candidatus Omnitrophica bacterium]|nr:DEAD/DEAH box helicase [Candidatus Omnitrophota bacterium]
MIHNYKYDPFQQKAIDFINQGHSVIVSAPTGAGKTAIAEHVIHQCLQNNQKVIYTAPIKALSNQKYREFQKLAKNQVGILTGDITLNPTASILIMTTEIFRNKILTELAILKEYKWIIFDEIHYIDDWDRGTVWEESLIFLPDHMKILGLSATIPNSQELKKWIESIHTQSIKIIKEDHRPVPLHFFYQCQGKIYDDLEKVVHYGYRSKEHKHLSGQKLPRYVHLKPNPLKPLIEDLFNKDMLPCIYFVFSRKRTALLAEEIQDIKFLTKGQSESILDHYDNLCELFELEDEPSALELRPFIAQGIAYHHAGMLPTLKEVVERLFTSRALKIIFTTETFALGINMPARTVIFDELRKYYGNRFATLRTRDFYQMAGRAGRRSIDVEGYVFCRINPHFIRPDEVFQMIYGKPEKIQSQFNASYATVLNLYQQYRDDLIRIYPRSFHFFQKRRFLHKKAIALLKGKIDILKELKHIQNNELTTKGFFASQVYGYELVLGELFSEGNLNTLSLQELGVLALAIVYEPRKGIVKPQPTETILRLESMAKLAIRKIHKHEKTVGLTQLSKRCYFHLSNVLLAWIKKKPFQQILEYTNADEGEIVRYMRMTLQLLRQMLDGPINEPLKNKVDKLIHLINRGVIDSKKQLRG